MKRMSIVEKESDNYKPRICHDCGVQEGQLHILTCSMEVCPICSNTLQICGHLELFWNGKIPVKRVPYVQPSVLCARCGEYEPKFFHDSEWEKYVIPSLCDEVLCKKCYLIMKKLFPNGWKKVDKKIEYPECKEMIQMEIQNQYLFGGDYFENIKCINCKGNYHDCFETVGSEL